MLSRRSGGVDDSTRYLPGDCQLISDASRRLRSFERQQDAGDVAWLTTQPDRVTVSEVQVLTSTVRVVTSARDLGVVINSRLTMADYVASVCRSAYYHLRQIRPTVQSLTPAPDGSKTLVQAFISGRLDYCNSLLYGMTDSLFQRLQSVLNAAARLITRTGRCKHITPVLRELHWLLVRRRVDFKLVTFMYKTLHGRIPRYLSGDC